MFEEYEDDEELVARLFGVEDLLPIGTVFCEAPPSMGLAPIFVSAPENQQFPKAKAVGVDPSPIEKSVHDRLVAQAVVTERRGRDHARRQIAIQSLTVACLLLISPVVSWGLSREVPWGELRTLLAEAMAVKPKPGLALMMSSAGNIDPDQELIERLQVIRQRVLHALPAMAQANLYGGGHSMGSHTK